MIFQFDGYELDDERRELRKAGALIELQGKVFAVLSHLAAHSSRVSTKDELMRSIWPEASVSDASLTRCISLVRRALGETEGDARIIRTVRGRGYRLGVPVVVLGGRGESPEEGLEAPECAAEPRRQRSPLVRWLAAMGGLAILFTWLARPYADLGPGFRSEPPVDLPETTIAVLPFVSDGETRSQVRLARAITSELGKVLGQFPELQVTVPGPSFPPGLEQEEDLRKLGRALGCGRILSGRLQADAREVRVAVELVDATTGFVRWSDVYPASWRESADLPARIAQEVVRAVTKTLPMGAVAVAEPSPVEAARYVVEGRLGIIAGTRESLALAAENYERVIALDPSDVRNHVALAIAYDGLWNLGPSGQGWMQRGLAAARRAVELAPGSADAYAARATLRRAGRDWRGAMSDFEKAIELGGSAGAYEGLANLYNILGRPQDGLAPAMRAVELAPLRPSPHRTLGRVHFFLGDDPLAISHFRRSVGLQPESAMIVGTLATALDRNGQGDEAAETLTHVLPPWMRPFSRIHKRLTGEDASLRMTLAIDRTASGRRCGHDALESAMVWARIGDRDRLMECLREASRDFLWYVASEPIFDPYRGDPEFRRIVRDAGFPVGIGPKDPPEKGIGDRAGPARLAD